MNIFVIVGLPGSGKSTLLNKLKKEYDFYYIDDMMNLSELPVTCENLVIADVHACNPKTRNKMIDIFNKKYENANIQFFYFENNPQQCLENARNRNDSRKVDTDIRVLSRVYDIPKGISVIPVYNGSNENEINIILQNTREEIIANLS